MKFKKPLIISFLCFLIMTVSVHGYITPDFELNSQATAIYNLDTGVYVYTDQADMQFAPASLTKIMTALVILNNSVNLDDEVVITAEMLTGLREANASVMGLYIGERITVKDLLYGLLLPSGADAARALAIYNSGQIDAFVNEMNRTADKLGATNTQFENPSGLDHENQLTTAHDMTKIMEAALEYDIFKEIISTSNYTTSPTNKHNNGISMKSTVKITDTSNIYYSPFVIGGKTGYTKEAGRCFASYGMSKNGVSYIIISLKSPNNGSATNSKAFQDAQNLYKWLDENFSLVTIKGDGEKAVDFSINHSFKNTFSTVYDGDVQILTDGLIDLESLNYISWGLEKYSAPIQKNQFVGYMRIYDGDTFLGYHNLKSSETVKYSNIIVFLENLQKFLQKNWLKLLFVLAVAFIIYVFYKNKKQKSIIRKRREQYVKKRLNELHSSKN